MERAVKDSTEARCWECGYAILDTLVWDTTGTASQGVDIEM